MIVCPSCGFEAADDFAFCPKCATALGGPLPITEERKLVTTLFCDLVGSTAMGHAADPESLDALLRQYNALARRIVEGHGGIVEKFIGDAVVAAFGVPATHEDDPERAVGAGLRLASAVEDLPPLAGHRIQVRIGINTGEALVRLDVRPGSGEGFLTGDAVNLGARLQAAAPPTGVVVGAATHALTRKAIVYEALEPVVVEGKPDPLEAWLAKEPLARTGVEGQEGSTSFVGRSVELSYLTALLSKAVDSSSPQVALIVGEPGIGKSRLVAELFAQVVSGTRPVTWRQGRCLPYGEGVTFWALAEIVRAHAGILETDSRETLEAKLEEVLPEGDDRPWFRQRLGALVGLEATEADRQENFTAWLRFLEGVATSEATVFVLEDLQWADDALLDFLEFFALHVARAPLMIVATARPELFERHASFAAVAHINRIALDPLSLHETEELVESVLEDVAGDLRASIAQQAEGNPFYAEESARLVRDHAQELKTPSQLPASVQAIIAARLDTLAPDLKVVLADAAVAGDAFWDGLVAVMGERSRDDLLPLLDELTARQLVYRVRSSSMAGEREYAFCHALAREVAYNQLPRTARARKHVAAAAWMEKKAGERGDELAQVVALHYEKALQYAQALGDGAGVGALREKVVASCSLAGDRVVALDFAASERYYARALELAGPEGSARPSLLVRWARTLVTQNRYKEAAEALREAIPDLRARGDLRLAAVAMTRLGSVLTYLGETVGDLGSQALRLLQGDEPSPELAEVLGWQCAILYLSQPSQRKEVIDVADRAIEVCERLGLPDSVDGLSFRGLARMELGDRGGLEDYERSITAARAQGLGEQLAMVLLNQCSTLFALSGGRASHAALNEGLEFSRRRGIEHFVVAFRATLVEALVGLGRWGEALRLADELVPVLEGIEDIWDLVHLRSQQALVLARSGRASEVSPWLEWLVTKGRESGIAFLRAYALLTAAETWLALGEPERSLDLLDEWFGEPTTFGEPAYVVLVPGAVRTALRCGDPESGARAAESFAIVFPIHEHVRMTTTACLDEMRGEHEAAAAGFASAASRWQDFGIPYEEAQALLGQGRCLAALGKGAEAGLILEQARAIFERLGARTPCEIAASKGAAGHRASRHGRGGVADAGRLPSGPLTLSSRRI